MNNVRATNKDLDNFEFKNVHQMGLRNSKKKVLQLQSYLSSKNTVGPPNDHDAASAHVISPSSKSGDQKGLFMKDVAIVRYSQQIVEVQLQQ